MTTFSKLFERVLTHEEVTLQVTGLQSWLLINACQLTYSHPHLHAEMKAQMYEMGHRFQQVFADSPELMALLEAGWQREHDVDHDEPDAETDAHVNRIISARFN